MSDFSTPSCGGSAETLAQRRCPEVTRAVFVAPQDQNDVRGSSETRKGPAQESARGRQFDSELAPDEV